MNLLLFRASLYTKLGPVSSTKFFPNKLKNLPVSIDLKLSQLVEKNPNLKVNFPNLAKKHYFSQFKENLDLFSQFQWHQNFPPKR